MVDFSKPLKIHTDIQIYQEMIRNLCYFANLHSATKKKKKTIFSIQSKPKMKQFVLLLLRKEKKEKIRCKM